MSKKTKDKEVYSIGDYIIDADSTEMGWIKVINRKTNWEMRVFLGSQAITSLEPNNLWEYFHALEIHSLMGISDAKLNDLVMAHVKAEMEKKPKRGGDSEKKTLAIMKLEEELKKLL